jgi:gliding motility-associated-like protein
MIPTVTPFSALQIRLFFIITFFVFQGNIFAQLTDPVETPPERTATAEPPVICKGGRSIIQLSQRPGTIIWETDASGVYTPIPGRTSDTLLTPPLTATTHYRAITTQAVHIDTSTVATVSVTASEGGTISVIPGATVCKGTPVTLKLVNNVGNTIQWEVDTTGTFDTIPGAVTNQYQTPPLSKSGIYRAWVTSSPCHDADLSSPISITVNPAAIGGIAKADTTIVCSGTGTTIRLTGNVGSSVLWQIDTTGSFVDIAGATGLSYATGPLTIGSKYRAKIMNGSCEAFSSQASVSVTPASIGGIASNDTTICTSNSIKIELKGNQGSIQWQIDTTGTFVNILNATAKPYTTPLLTKTSKFRALITSGTCPAAPSTTTIVTVMPGTTPGVVAADVNTLCTGSGTTLHLIGSTVGATIQWQSKTTGAFANITGANAATLATGVLNTTTSYQAIVTANNCQATSNAVTVTVHPIPTAGTVAADLNPLCSGTGTTIHLTGATAGATIQWQSKTTGVFADITGANAATLATGALSTTTSYQAIVTANNCQAISNAVTVTVNGTPIAGTAAADASPLCSGTGTTIRLTGATAGATIQWQSKTTGVFADITGANATTLATDALNTTTSYQAIVTANNCQVTSNAITVTVNPIPTPGTVAADLNPLCSGTGTTLRLTGATAGATIQWQSKTTGVFADITGANAATLATGALNTTTGYQAIVTTNNCQATSNAITVNVNATPIAGTAAADASPLCSGNSTNINLTGATAGATIQWQSKTTGAFADISGANAATLVTGGLNITTSYQAIVTVNNCSVISNIVTVVINTAAVPGIATADANPLCSGTGTTLHLTGATAGATIQWQSKTTGVFADIIGANSATLPTGVLNTTTSYQAIVTANSCEAISNTVTVTVNAIPTPGNAAAVMNPVCSGTGTTINLTGATAGAIIQWQSKTTGVFLDINGANAAAYATGALTTTTSYQAIVTANNCSATSNVITVNVNATPTAGNAAAGATPICSGNNTTISLTGATAGATIQWQSKTTGVFADIIGANASTYPTGILTATTSYQAIVTANNCSATSNVVAVIINAIPSPGTATADANSLCNGGNTQIKLAGATAGATIQWQNKTTGVFADIIGANASTYPTGVLNTTTSYQAIVTLNNCSAISNIVTVTINPSGIPGTASADVSTLCAGDSTVLRLTGQSGAIQWQSFTSGSFNNINGATSATYNTHGITTTTRYRAVVGGNGCTSNSNEVTVTVNPIPVGGNITPSAATTCTGNSVTLTLKNYVGQIQWQTDANGPFADIAQETDNTYQTPVLTATTRYRAVLKNSGCPDVNSTVSTVTIAPMSLGGAALATPSTICNNQTTTIKLQNSVGTTIQWQKKTTGSYANIPQGLNSSEFTTLGITSTTFYRAIVQNSDCPSAISDEAQVNIAPSAVGGTATADSSTICSGSTTAIRLTGYVGTGIQWQSDESGSGIFANVSSNGNSNVYQVINLTKTTSYRAIVQSNNCPTAISSTAKVTITPPALGGTISANPQSICSGATSKLTLSGYTGTDIKWEKNISGTFVTIAGAIGPEYTTIALTDDTEYRAIVTNGHCGSAVSTKVTVEIIHDLAGGIAAADQTAICSGTSTVIRLTGYTGSIQWQKDEGTGFTNIVGAVSTPYTTPNLTLTTKYRAVVSGGSCADVISTVTTVTINPPSIAGTAIPAKSTVCSGTGTTVTLNGNDGTIAWQVDDSGTGNGAFTDVGSSATTIPTGTLTKKTRYRAKVTRGSCAPAFSAPVTIDVAPASVAGIISSSAMTVCPGSTVTLTLNGSAGSIQWLSDTSGAFANIPQATSTPYTTFPITKETSFRAVVTNGSCAAAATGFVTISIAPALSGGNAIAIPSTVCKGTNTSIRLKGHTGNIQWQTDATGVFADIPNETDTIYNTPNLTVGTRYRAILSSGNCPIAISTEAIVTVIPASVGGTATATSPTVCSGTGTTVTLSGNTGSIHWQSDTSGVFKDIPGATNVTHNTGPLTKNTSFRAVVTSNGCSSVYSVPVFISVTPASLGGTASALQSSVCSGGTAVLNLTGEVGSQIFWQSDATGAYVDIAGATGKSYSTTLTTLTHFRARVKNGNCAMATSNVVTISITPALLGGTAKATPSSVCKGTTTSIKLSGHTGSQIQWQTNASGSYVDMPGEHDSTLITPPLSVATNYRAHVNGSGCPQVTSTVASVSIIPLSVGGIVNASPSTICSGETSTLTLSGNVGSIQWQSDETGVFADIPGQNGQSYTTPPLTNSTSYQAIVTSGSCSSDKSTTTLVSVVPSSASGFAKATPSTVCNGGTSKLTLTGYVGDKIQWQTDATGSFQDIPGATNAEYTTPGLSVSTTYRAVVSNGNCASIVSNTITITITPVLNGGTASAVQSTICKGTFATIKLVGQSGSIQWQTNASGTFKDINSANSNTLNTPNLTVPTSYRAELKSGGCAPQYSNTVTIFIIPSSVGGVATPKYATICSGEKDTITLTGHTGSIQWQIDTSGSFVNIAGATAAFYETLPLTVATSYRAVVTSSGCAPANSSEAFVSVAPASKPGIATASALKVCSGATSTLTLTGYIGAIHWQSDATGIFADLPGGTGMTCTTPPLYTTTSFRALVTNGNCRTLASNVLTIKITPALSGGTTSANPTTVCKGTSSTLSLKDHSGAVHWQTNSSGSWIDIDTLVATDTFYITPPLLIPTSYRALVWSKGCASATSTPVTVSVSPASTAGSAIAVPSSICNGETTTINLTGYAGTIKWQTNTTGKFLDIPLATGSSYTTPPLTKSTAYRAIVKNGSCLSDSSNIVVISIVPPSVGGLPTATASTVCVGGTTTITLTKYTGTSIQWQKDSSGTFVDIKGGLGTSYSTLPLSGPTTYRAKVTNGNCPPAISSPITILVTDELEGGMATVVPSTVCDNTPTTINLANYKGSIQWQTNASGSFVNIPGALTTPYTTPPLTVNTQYRALVTSGNCPAVFSNTVTAYVTPKLSPGMITATPSTICAGENTKLKIKGYTGNVQWQRDSSKVFVNIPGQTADTCMISQLTSSTNFRAKISSGNCAPVYADSITINVNVVTSPAGDSVQKFCSLVVPTIKDLAAGSAGDSIKWYTVPTGGTALAPSTPLVNGGVYFATRSAFGCESYKRLKVTVTVFKSANVMTQPNNVTTCPGLTARFSVAGDGTGLTYKWMVSETGVGNYKYVTDNTTYKGSNTDTLKILNVSGFMNGFSYKCVVKGTCSPADSALSTDVVLTVSSNTAINQQPASISMCYGNSASFNVNASGAGLTYQWQVDSTSVFLNLKNDTTYKNTTTFALKISAFSPSMENYKYRCVITSPVCGTIVYTDPVTISFDENCNVYPLTVPTGFSPNGDGVNDKLVIGGIENYPGAVLRIYNSWGDLVYEQADYKNDWDAKANVKNVVGAGKLPAGTYYIYVDLKNGKKGKATFLLIKY